MLEQCSNELGNMYQGRWKHVITPLIPANSELRNMLQRTKNGKNGKKKKGDNRNTFHDNALRISLIFGVFATNCAAGGLHASSERRFVKKIQHLFDEETHLSLSTSFVLLVGWFSCFRLRRSEGTQPMTYLERTNTNSLGSFCHFLLRAILIRLPSICLSVKVLSLFLVSVATKSSLP